MRHVLQLPLRTRSVPNQREHWGTRAKRVALERGAVALAWPWEWKGVRWAFPLRALLTRVAPKGRRLDDDNLRGALKAVRDEVAKQLGVDDGQVELVRWEYAEERVAKRGEFAVRVELVSPLPTVGDDSMSLSNVGCQIQDASR